jgi:hypothetical protein
MLNVPGLDSAIFGRTKISSNANRRSLALLSANSTDAGFAANDL